jgi:hypothetical protein
MREVVQQVPTQASSGIGFVKFVILKKDFFSLIDVNDGVAQTGIGSTTQILPIEDNYYY